VWFIFFVVFVHIRKGNHAARHYAWSVSNEHFTTLTFILCLFFLLVSMIVIVRISFGSLLLLIEWDEFSLYSYNQGRPLPIGQPGQSEQLAPPPPYPVHKNLPKNCEALQYCDRNEFIELTEGTPRVLMSKAATNNICSNKHKA
jgi:hypothetical protein